MVRKPLDIYCKLIAVSFYNGADSHIESVVDRFNEHSIAGVSLADHLARFLRTVAGLVTVIDDRDKVSLSDLTLSIDLLDYLTSTSKWWKMSRKRPWFALKPPTRDPREFMSDLGSLRFEGTSISRTEQAAGRLLDFLHDHGTDKAKSELLTENISSMWLLLSAFVCRGEGRNVVVEKDFETAFDTVRVLLFHTLLDDYKALTATRRMATNSLLTKAAEITFSPSFERSIESSPAAHLEKVYSSLLAQVAAGTPNASRFILTNSLKLLTQIEATKRGIMRVEKDLYDELILGALERLGSVGVSPGLFKDEKAVLALFKRLQPTGPVKENLKLLTRRLEGLLVKSTGNRDFLLQYSRLVPRLVALILLVAGATKDPDREFLEDYDLKRGLILVSSLIE